MMLEAEGEDLAWTKLSGRRGGIQNPCLFHSQVMGAAGATFAFCQSETLARYFSEKLLEHKMIANKLIHEELEVINNGFSWPTAELIMAILTLVTLSGELNEWTEEDIHTKSPLAQAQPLGRVKVSDTHFQAVHALVKRIGGLLVLQS